MILAPLDNPSLPQGADMTVETRGSSVGEYPLDDLTYDLVTILQEQERINRHG